MRTRLHLIVMVIILSGISTLASGGVFDKAEYQSRRTQLMKSIPDGIALIVGTESGKQNSNFIYFTGVEEPRSILLIDGMKKESILFLPLVNSSEKLIAETGVARVMPLSDLTRLLASSETQTKLIYTPYRNNARREIIDPDRRISRELNFISQIKERFPSYRFKNIRRAIGELRVIKSPAEIEVMRESGRISSLGHIEMLKSASPGVYEWELAKVFEDTIKKLGAQGFGYSPIVPSDPKWYDSHYSENSRKIEDGDLVMPDVGGEYKDYVVDISATFPVNGKFTPEQKRLNRIICAVEDAMQKVFRPGIRSGEMRAEVQEILTKQGIDMDKEGVYRIEANHWIGLDVHDAGPSSRNTILRPGMIVASDPAIKIRDKDGNVIDGVKIENTLLITEDGCENLTSLVPRTVEDIEKVMAEKGILDIRKEQGK